MNITKHEYAFAAMAAFAFAALLPTEAEYYWLAVGIHNNAGYNVNGGLGNYLILTNDDPSVEFDAVKLYDVRRTVDGGTKLHKINSQNGTPPYEGCGYGGAHYDLTLPIRDEAGNAFTFVGLKNEAFNNNYYIGSIKLPDTLEYIEGSVFKFARYLKSFSFPADPSDMTTLGDHTFDSCDRLEGPIVWPPQFTVLGDYGFANCFKLKGFYGPSVTKVGNSAFNSDSALKAVEFGASVEFGSAVFQNTRGSAYQVFFHDAPPVLDSGNNLIGGSNGVMDWWGTANANATLYVPFNATKDGPTANWLQFKTDFEAAVSGNLITWPTQNQDGTWNDGSIYAKTPNKTDRLRFWDPDAQTASALLAY